MLVLPSDDCTTCIADGYSLTILHLEAAVTYALDSITILPNLIECFLDEL